MNQGTVYSSAAGQPLAGLGTGLVRCEPGTPFLVSCSPRRRDCLSAGVWGAEIGKRKLIVAWRKCASHSYNPTLTYSTQGIAQAKREIELSLSSKSKHQSSWRVMDKKDGFFNCYYLFVLVSNTKREREGERRKEKTLLGFWILCRDGVSLWCVIAYSLPFILGSLHNEVRVHKWAIPKLQCSMRENYTNSSHCWTIVSSLCPFYGVWLFNLDSKYRYLSDFFKTRFYLFI